MHKHTHKHTRAHTRAHTHARGVRAGIRPDLAAKDWDFAKIVPGEHSTYNYPNEEGYPQYRRVPPSTAEYP